MKTTIDIPEKLLRETMRFEKAGTKREVVVKAMEQLHRRHKMAALVKFAGTFGSMMSNEEIEALEEAEEHNRP